MKMNRRQWLRLMGMAAVASAIPRSLRAAFQQQYVQQPLIRDLEAPMFDLPGQVSAPAIIESIELLRSGGNYFVRTRTTDGAEGLTGTKGIVDFIPLFTNLAAPFFIGKDARDIESLIDGVYRANYKLAGIPFWSTAAFIEQSILDLLGKMAGKPVGALLGGVIRDEIPVYLSGSDRVLSAEEEVDIYVRGVAETGANAVKFKIGGRISRNQDAYPGRTDTLVELARKKLGDSAWLAADANGSYDVGEGIRVGRMLEELGYAYFEEPCPWQNFEETLEVAQRLTIPIAAGEQDSSLPMFEWMIRHDMADIVQPDMNYNGGLIRAIRVARLAASVGKTIVPHNTQTTHNSCFILQFASCTPNAVPYMEYPWRQSLRKATWYTPDFQIVDGKLKVPTTPGMGVQFDPDFIARCEVVARIDGTGRVRSNSSGSGSTAG
jgi:L-alanine-DL-glutamate epimerase-like enolase superfamily enzyme